MSPYDQNEAPMPRAGDTVRIEINGCNLVLSPMPYGKLKRVMKLFFSNMENITKIEAKDVVPAIIEMFDSKLDELIDLVFDKEKNPFLNREWYENNVTLPHMKRIIETLIIINDVNKSFFGQRGGTPTPPPPVQPELNLAEAK
jgi:hypothetical protein